LADDTEDFLPDVEMAAAELIAQVNEDIASIEVAIVDDAACGK